ADDVLVHADPRPVPVPACASLRERRAAREHGAVPCFHAEFHFLAEATTLRAPVPHSLYSIPDTAFPPTASMRSAACSAIMIAGAFVLPPGKFGITEASTTRKPCRPCTRSSESTTAR